MPRKTKTEVTLRRDRLRQMRERRGLSYQELADKSGVSRRQIIRYEKEGGAEPTAENVARLAKALQCSADWLLDLTGEPTAIMPEIAPDILRMARQFSELPESIRNVIKAILRSQTNGGNGK